MSENIKNHIANFTSLEKFLRLFASVRKEEGITSLLMLMNIFLILMAYYFIKPVREGWLSISIIQGLTKLEVKAYSAFAQSLILILVVLPIYAKLASIWTRKKLITIVGVFFGLVLFLFWLFQPDYLFQQIPYLGIAFYLFVGIFGVTLVAQFWSFASDIFGKERGRRLFPLVAVGAAAGGAMGSWIGERLIASNKFEPFDLMLLALVPLIATILLARWTDRRGVYGHPSDYTKKRWLQPATPKYDGAFKLLLKYRYLTAMALMVLLFNWVIASGDNILFGLVQQSLEEQLSAQVLNGEDYSKQLKSATTAFYGSLYFWVNIIGLILQAFVVSRLLKFGGFSSLMLVTPLISLLAYISMAVSPILGVIKAMKVAENSSNYSMNNTARHMLWLPTSNSMLYQAKPTIDTLFVRIGDGFAALTVLLGTRLWNVELNTFLIINIVLTLAWLAVAYFLAKEHKRWNENEVVKKTKV
jgi:AAA family ATP:ADP antiporter